MTRTALIACLLSVGCFSGYRQPGSGGEGLRVHRGTFIENIVLTGELDAAQGQVITVPALPTWQTSIKWIAADGTEVKVGDKVAELDSSSFVTDLDKKRQAVVQAEQDLSQKESEGAADSAAKALDAEKKRVDYDKASLDAAIPEELVSAREYADRQVKYKRAEVELAKADEVLRGGKGSLHADRANLELNLAKAKRELAVAERAIAALDLTAPTAGIVVIHDCPFEPRKLQEGDAVWVAFPLALIPELKSLEVTAALADVDDRKISVGMPTTVILDAYPSSSFTGRVASISAVAAESTRMSLRRAFHVVIKLDQIDLARMRPGLSVRAAIRRATVPNALLIPRSSLDLRGKSPKARLADGSESAVTLGPCNAQECVVTSGLREGDRLAPAPETAGDV